MTLFIRLRVFYIPRSFNVRSGRHCDSIR